MSLLEHQNEQDFPSRGRERSASGSPEREVDAVLAERLFGWHAIRSRPNRWNQPDVFGVRNPGDWEYAVPAYSTTYEGMGLVLEAMHARGYHWRSGQNGDGYYSHFYSSVWAKPGSSAGPLESLPMAVALAALAALSDEQSVAETDGDAVRSK